MTTKNTWGLAKVDYKINKKILKPDCATASTVVVFTVNTVSSVDCKKQKCNMHELQPSSGCKLQF